MSIKIPKVSPRIIIGGIVALAAVVVVALWYSRSQQSAAVGALARASGARTGAGGASGGAGQTQVGTNPDGTPVFGTGTK